MAELRTIDLTYENQLVKKAFFRELDELYDSNLLMIGPALEALEQKLAQEMGTACASLTGAGTMALQVAAKALELGRGDEVIVPANTFFGSAIGPIHAGAAIRLADADPDTLNLSAATVEKVFTKKTKAIVGVHIYGNPFDAESLKQFGVPILEDASHGFSGRLGGKKVGSLGTISAFSAGPIKGFGGLGHGGFIGYDNKEWKEYIEAYINNGQKARHIASVIGHNFRMDSVNALFLLKKLEVWEKVRAQRNTVRKTYNAIFDEAGIAYQKALPEADPCLWVYVVKLPAEIRDRVKDKLEEKKIFPLVQYTVTINQLPIWDEISAGPAEVPVSESLVKSVLSLPVHAGITQEAARSIAEATVQIVKELT